MLSRKFIIALAVSGVAVGYLACGGSQAPTNNVYSADFLNGVSQAPPSTGPVPGSSVAAEPPPEPPPPVVEEPVDAGVMDSGMVENDVPSPPVDAGRRARPRPAPRGRDAGR